MKKLKWGQTPFDRMTKKELVEHSRRMYQALVSTNSCLRIDKANNPESLYWSYEGSGGRALDMAKQTLDAIHAQFDDEQIYRMFYRYALNLIFNNVDKGDWYICDKDKMMLNPGKIDCPQCGGRLRKITMNDLKI